jgi:hypothetical protein
MLFSSNTKINVSRRNSRRINLRINFEVFAYDENGVHFSTRALTRDVSREGGCLLLDRDLKSGDIMKLRSPRGNSFIAHVCWSNYDTNRNTRQVGFRLTSNRGWVLHESSPHKTANLFFVR